MKRPPNRPRRSGQVKLADRVGTYNQQERQVNIDELTIGQAKELAGMFPSAGNSPVKAHPLNGRRVVAVLTNGFIHFGTLHQDGDVYRLEDSSNLRYWKQRDGGLPEFAKLGPRDDDRIDVIGTVYFDSALFFYPIGDWK